ncbi:MAG: hypothetical protein ABI151_18500 [Chitinophagaceae bacterium]
MNIINKGLVSLALLPKFLYRKMGADVNDLRLILTTKLLIDDRRPNTLHVTRSRKQTKSISLATVGTMIISAVMGLFFLVSFAIGSNMVTQMTIYFTLFTILLTLTLITDFTSVLIDVRDNQIILPKPVTDKTFVLARLLHIFIHINKIVLPMSLAGLIFMGIRHGAWQAVVLLFAIFMVTVFSIFVINTIYLAILRVTTPQKFKTIISYVQIAMTIAIYGASQILPRMIDAQNFLRIDFNNKSWRWSVPTYWFARGWNFFQSLQGGRENLAGAILLLAVPVFSMWIVIRYLAPSFTRKLATMTSGSDGDVVMPKQALNESRSFWPRLTRNLSTLLTKSPEEKMAFQLTWKLTSRLRDFKLKVYPGIGYMAVFIFIMVFPNFRKNGMPETFSFAPGIVLGMTYASGFIFITSINQLQYSESFKASWFYLTTPIKNPGHLFSGALKAAAVKLFVPFALIASVIEIVLYGYTVIPNLLLAFSNVLASSIFISLLTFQSLPFSSGQTASQQTSVMFRFIGCSLVAGLFGFLHYLIFSFLPVVIIGIVLSLIANWLLINTLKNRSWSRVRASYED